jgi:hypothetical protein
MWTYKQSTGQLIKPDNSILTTGYSGKGQYKNKPIFENLIDKGCIPKGTYKILPGYTDNEKGKFCLKLSPDKNNQMFGRSGFMIHGDDIKNPGTASDGCIILNYKARIEIDSGKDRILKVIN